MKRELTWGDAYDIAVLLSEKHPEINPGEVGWQQLPGYIKELPGFNDNPSRSNESKLKAIQKAWQEEFLERTRD